MLPTDSSASIVYGSFKEAQRKIPAGISVTPLPSYDVYKVAREEELAAYRAVCRVFAMHHGVRLPKAAQRLLEDLRDTLAISVDRGAMEGEMAAADAIVQSVWKSGILKRRDEFFDGVEDVELPDRSADRAADDGRSLYLPAGKAAKLEGGHRGSVTASNGSAAGAPALRVVNTAKRKHILTSVTRIGKEIEQAANELLYPSHAAVQADSMVTLAARKETLLQLRRELRDS